MKFGGIITNPQWEEAQLKHLMEKYKFEGFKYNLIDLSTKQTYLVKVYKTRGHKQFYAHFKERDKELITEASNGNEEARGIVSSIIDKLNQNAQV